MFPDPVIGQQSFVFIDTSREPLAKRFEEIEHRTFAVHIQTLDFFFVSYFFDARETGHFLRQITIDATGTIVSRMHAGTRDRFITIHQVFALAKAIQENGHRANIEAVRPQPHQVIEQASDFIEHHADILRTYRRRDAHQFFDRQYITVLVAHHRYIIQTIHITDGLVVRLALGEFFGGPVQQANMRIGLQDDLSIHFQDQAKHAMRGRVLRSEIEREIPDISHRAALFPGATQTGRRGE